MASLETKVGERALFAESFGLDSEPTRFACGEGLGRDSVTTVVTCDLGGSGIFIADLLARSGSSDAGTYDGAPSRFSDE